MSLFKWSTPERRKADQALPIIPNEIYIHIFEYIAPPISGRLAPEELEIFTRLSRVCRFFANFCLPRIFEFMKFSGSTSRDDTPTGLRNDAIYKASREATLCTQIAAKQPLALSLAKQVRVCHFTKWDLDAIGSWAVRPFVMKYIAGMLHMKNIRDLRFSASFVDVEHWRAIASLESLEELSFNACQFLQGPADVEPEERVKIKVSRLRVIDCTGNRQPAAAIEARYLRTLAMDPGFFDQIDWLPQSALKKLRCCWEHPYPIQYWSLAQMHTVLMQAPRSIETMWLSVDVRPGVGQGTVRGIFDDPAWKNLALLRSLTLQVLFEELDKSANMLSFVLDCISALTDLQSFTLDNCVLTTKISPPEVRRILHDKLRPSCRLKYADIFGNIFHLVEGEWSQVSCSTP